MAIIDKYSILDQLVEMKPLTIEVGCGPRKRYERSVGVDAIDFPSVDIVGNAHEVLRAMPPGVADLISSSHFLEHVDDLPRMLEDMVRVLRPGGKLEVTVPHFSHPYFYSDPTHKVPFGLYTFSYLTAANPFRRTVPGYVSRSDLVLESADLIFKSTPPFYVRHAWKKIIQILVNSSTYAKEFYEENLCYVFPCYEIRFLLVKQ